MNGLRLKNCLLSLLEDKPVILSETKKRPYHKEEESQKKTRNFKNYFDEQRRCS